MAEAQENTEVHMKCKRGSDRLTEGQECPSLSAIRMSAQGSQNPSFKCVKCGHIWSVALGGAFTL